MYNMVNGREVDSQVKVKRWVSTSKKLRAYHEMNVRETTSINNVKNSKA